MGRDSWLLEHQLTIGGSSSIHRRGSIKTCHVQKHGTEIIEVEVWLYFMTCSKYEEAKIKWIPMCNICEGTVPWRYFRYLKCSTCTWHVLILPEFRYLNMDMVCFDMDMAHFEITRIFLSTDMARFETTIIHGMF